MKNIRWMQGVKRSTGRRGPRHWTGAATALLLMSVVAGCVPKITSSGTATGTAGQPFTYQITATRNPTSFGANVPPPTGLSVNTASGLISGAPQQDGDFPVTLKARNFWGTGTKQLALHVNPSGTPPPPPPPPPDSHTVVTEKELFIIAPAVLGDTRAQPGGSWHIRSALQRIAGSGQNVEAFAQAWFATWSNNDTVAGSSETFVKRPWVTTALQQAWQANTIQLIAIVNRIDLTRFANGSGQPPTSLGEGRFVYEVRNGNTRLPFTIIFEYKLPVLGGDPAASLVTWAQRWHALGRAALGTPTQFPAAYLTELEAITDAFSANGTLNQIRANEFLPTPGGQLRQWEMREFHFVTGPVRLQQVPVLLTPALAHNNQSALVNFITGNQADIIAGNPVTIPAALQAAVSPVPSPSFKWTAPGANPRATFITSFNTCSGCHAGNTAAPPNTGTLFQHIGVNAPNMSPFLTGSIPLEHPLPPAANTVTTHNEMSERRKMLAAFAGDAAATPSAVTATLSELVKARANRPH